MQVEVLDLGFVGYSHAFKLQKELLSKVKTDQSPDTLIFCEHRDVFTIGRSGSSKNILCGIDQAIDSGIEVIFTDRGGDVTYHGKGQLVVYPIFDLRKYRKDIHLFLRRLEQVIMGVLETYGVCGSIIPDSTGVWVGDAKIASIGIAVSRWVSYHGLSININTDLGFFSMVNPCGYKELRMTSLAKILGKRIDLERVKQAFCRSFAAVFGLNLDLTPSHRLPENSLQQFSGIRRG